ncbi:MAG: hypothetical protein MOB07_23150 [Acidobacteria bacterium]|nr:hypothetical protein [Acidobacteriota bacterium]
MPRLQRADGSARPSVTTWLGRRSPAQATLSVNGMSGPAGHFTFAAGSPTGSNRASGRLWTYAARRKPGSVG